MVEARGWDMYDPRLTIKRPVKTYFDDGTTIYAIALGDCYRTCNYPYHKHSKQHTVVWRRVR
ncbi:unnamed protein product [marine sediment metagenome]|uniref:Uncharacterized protein n=1 Tax=marine sediment metagenome TaxID=412755 RepID=X1CFL0_9ZZZZ